MSIASSSSSLQALRGSLRPSATCRRALNIEFKPFRPVDDAALEPRPPRPSTPTFFTGRPAYHTAISELETALLSAQQSLRSAHIYPLPSTLPTPQPPRAAWHPAPVLSNLLGTQLKTNAHRRILDLLNELHALRHVAALSEQAGVENVLDGVLARYEREERGGVEGGKKAAEVDEWGRAYGMGRRKESSARVWIVPSPSGRRLLDAHSEGEAVATVEEGEGEVQAEILVNHVPIAIHFPKITDRETVLRPLRLSGLIGAFNVFALARGGGTSGQAGAVGLALARALVVMRSETEEVLQRDGALMRDTRMVERKKTGSAKARKKYAWVKR
ncbi:ribosomal protein S9/S16-domain-containing protein [Dioszegia hungarica]|uniref:Ribosomal protein S9/S16-domain-containing protein n=1 Tax=Dioszegia hungarica TaxID=4972 RepID=A0AA38LUN6_9TREE|nr:ribosomal protein S9/S16-domain-containing protein [Dioszegia hungarica]KAI9637587.1 ribosomal protein S9/S16-domain-containing protein [Dioszegia hungarica]